MTPNWKTTHGLPVIFMLSELSPLHFPNHVRSNILERILLPFQEFEEILNLRDLKEWRLQPHSWRFWLGVRVNCLDERYKGEEGKWLKSCTIMVELLHM